MIILWLKGEGTSLKDRQHQSQGGFGFSFIASQSKEVEYRVIHEMKATFTLYRMISSYKWFCVN